jgi:hypothetical protein
MALSLIVLRVARLGLRSFGEPVFGLRAFGVGLWLTALLVTLSIFGTALRAQTHQRALAAITYACGALVLAVGYGLAGARVVVLLRAAGETMRRLALITLGALSVAVLAFLAMRFARVISVDAASAPAAATVVDVIAFGTAALGGSLAWTVSRRVLAIAGPPVAVFLTALGITTLRDPPVRHAVGENAPAFAPIGDLVSGQ